MLASFSLLLAYFVFGKPRTKTMLVSKLALERVQKCRSFAGMGIVFPIYLVFLVRFYSCLILFSTCLALKEDCKYTMGSPWLSAVPQFWCSSQKIYPNVSPAWCNASLKFWRLRKLGPSRIAHLSSKQGTPYTLVFPCNYIVDCLLLKLLQATTKCELEEMHIYRMIKTASSTCYRKSLL